jgi:hypothetical protein
MQVTRLVGLVDIAMIVVLAVFVVLPPRPQYMEAAIPGSEPSHFALALAEARTIARPTDGTAVDELVTKLSEAGQKDWAIDFAVLASERMKDAPDRWKALMAASTVFVARFDVVPGLDFVNRALVACESAQAKDPAACPGPDQVRMQLYAANLGASVKSGFNPRTERDKVQRAGESALLQIHLDPHDRERGSAAPRAPAGATDGGSDSATAP